MVLWKNTTLKTREISIDIFTDFININQNIGPGATATLTFSVSVQY